MDLPRSLVTSPGAAPKSRPTGRLGTVQVVSGSPGRSQDSGRVGALGTCPAPRIASARNREDPWRSGRADRPLRPGSAGPDCADLGISRARPAPPRERVEQSSRYRAVRSSPPRFRRRGREAEWAPDPPSGSGTHRRASGGPADLEPRHVSATPWRRRGESRARSPGGRGRQAPRSEVEPAWDDLARGRTPRPRRTLAVRSADPSAR